MENQVSLGSLFWKYLRRRQTLYIRITIVNLIRIRTALPSYAPEGVESCESNSLGQSLNDHVVQNARWPGLCEWAGRNIGG